MADHTNHRHSSGSGHSSSKHRHSSGDGHSGAAHSSGTHHAAAGADKSKESYRLAVCYAFSFILSILLLMMTVCFVSLSCLFSEGFFCRIMGEEYYRAVLSEVNTLAEDYTIPAEFDISVLDSVFTENNVQHDVNGHITAAFRGYNYTPDLTDENNRLYENVALYIAENHIEMDDTEEAVISAYIKEIDEIYLDKVKIPGINLIKVAREKVKGYVTFALIFLFAGSFILTVLLLRLYRYPHQGMRFVAYAAGGCALMSFALPFGLYLSKVYEHVLVTPEYFYIFVSGYLRCLLESFMKTALLWLIITLGCMVFIYFSKNGMLRGKVWQKISKNIGRSLRRL